MESNNEIEIFKTIGQNVCTNIIFPDYEISNFGRVRNLKTMQIMEQTGIWEKKTYSISLKGILNGPMTQLRYINNIREETIIMPGDIPIIQSTYEVIGDLVAKIFLPKIFPLLKYVYHKDGDRNNSHVNNLQWVLLEPRVNPVNNTSGYVGVSKNKSGNRWKVI